MAVAKSLDKIWSSWRCWSGFGENGIFCFLHEGKT